VVQEQVCIASFALRNNLQGLILDGTNFILEKWEIKELISYMKFSIGFVSSCDLVTSSSFLHFSSFPHLLLF